MRKGKNILFVMLLALMVASFAQVAALGTENTQYFNPNPLSYYGSDASIYWPSLGQEDCQARQDFLVELLPGACSPLVVRSDLLEEQNVPVFCQLTGIKINPLIDVPQITSISFRNQGQQSKEIAGIGFHPARAALKLPSQTRLIGSPLLNNLGYLVVNVRSIPAEKNMPEFVEANLTALIKYNALNALGIGKTQFMTPVLSEDEWQQRYKESSFWKGKGYVRVLSIEEDSKGKFARVGIYTGVNNRLTVVNLHEGETTQTPVYLPGFYCSAGLNVNVQDIKSPDTKVKIVIDEDELWVGAGQSVLDDECRVSKIEPNVIDGGKVTLSCRDSSHTLELNPPKAKIRVLEKIGSTDQETTPVVSVGDVVVEKNNQKVYLGYVGSTEKSFDTSFKVEKENFAVLVIPSSAVDQKYMEAFSTIVDRAVKGRRWVGFKKFGYENLRIMLGIDKGTLIGPLDKGVESWEQLKKSIESLFAKTDKKVLIKIITVNGEEKEGSDEFTTLSQYHFSLEELEGASNANYKTDAGKAMENYYGRAIDSYKDLSQKYGMEKKGADIGVEQGDYEGAVALEAAAKLAYDVRKFGDNNEILKELIRKYPNTPQAENAQHELDSLKSSNEKASTVVIDDAGKAHSVRLLEIREPTGEEKGVKVLINGQERTILEGEVIEDGGIEALVENINDQFVQFKYTYLSGTSGESTLESTVRIKKGSSADIPKKDKSGGKISVAVREITFKEEAAIRLEPLVQGGQTEANFTVRIGIEKRAIKLSNEEAKEMINGLNTSIAQWETVVTNLGTLIKTWKATCFATSLTLFTKNFLTGFSGESTARSKVMKRWEGFCADDVGRGKKYSTFHSCFNSNSDQITQDVNAYNGIVQSVNGRVDAIKKLPGVTKPAQGAFEQTAIDQKKYMEESQKEILDKYGDVLSSEQKDFIEKMPEIEEKRGTLTLLDVRDIRTDLEIKRLCQPGQKQFSDSFCTQENLRIADQFKNVYAPMAKNLDAFVTDTEEFAKANPGLELMPIEILGEPISASGAVAKEDVTVETGDAKKTTVIKKGERYKYLNIEGTNYAIVAGTFGTGIDRMYKMNGKEIESTPLKLNDPNLKLTDATKDKLGRLKIDTLIGDCSHPFNEDQKKVRYFENAPYKGMPAVVPIDLQQGWYAAVPPYRQVGTLGGESLKAYDSSSMVNRFWICNVGSNQRIEFLNEPTGDDAQCCTEYFAGSSAEYSTQMKGLIAKARSAILSAASQYGSKTVSISGVGTLTADIQPLVSPVNCEEFMSPKDCHLMFNVCDPVLCPASRCDFGGRYQVTDVVQTGVIGSIMLCLPNIKEGIFVPVCLTGIHAGLDNYVQILKATQQCLQENLKSGRTVGICDQMRSIYMCEFFWKQAAPLAKVGIPQLIESLSGRGRGGGEYMTVQDSFNKLDQSVDYFTNYYGVNAFKAFQARSTEQIGSEACKAFISARYPTNKDMIDKLLEPDSPTQFHAVFSEDKLQDVTVPPTSHYKVSYRIYSGKDQGVYFNVYLKRSPEQELYALPSILQVPQAFGFIPKGKQTDMSTDFQAPAGYKELCVRINAEERCGFQQVTTSFAADELKNLYLQEQATQEVETEEECIQGTPSISPLTLNLNVQAGAQEAITPAIYKRGIVRICAGGDPSAASTPGRWQAVGYCDSNKKIRCWIDSNSLNDTISDSGILDETLDTAKNLLSEIDKTQFWSEQQSDSELAQAESETGVISTSLEKLEKISTKDLETGTQQTIESKIDEAINPALQKMRDVMQESYLNEHKIKALKHIADIYDKVTRKFIPLLVIQETTTQSQTLPEYIKVDVVLTKEQTGLSEEILVTKVIEGSARARGVDTGKDYQFNEGKWEIIIVQTPPKDGGVTASVECGECARGLFDTCTYDECHNQGNCYIQQKFLKDGCEDCPSLDDLECDLYNNQQECGNNPCGISSGSCAWNNDLNTCSPVGGYEVSLSQNSISYVQESIVKNLSPGMDNAQSEKISGILINYRTGLFDKETALQAISDEGVSEIYAEEMINLIDTQTVPGEAPKKSFWDSVTDFGVDSAEAAQSSNGNWAETAYNPDDYLRAKLEDEYSERKGYYDQVEASAKEYSINFNLVRALIQVESNWETEPVEDNGGGLMQLTSSAIDDLRQGTCSRILGKGITVDKNINWQNIRGGTAYFACQLKEFENADLAIAAYTSGPTIVRNECRGISWNECKNRKKALIVDVFNDVQQRTPEKVRFAYIDIVRNSPELPYEPAQDNQISDGKRIIVIDPGHGGIDTGMRSDNGILEKDVNLAIGLKLRELLERQGYSAVMTRSSDEALKLGERRAIARDAGADYFISIHANTAVPCPSKGGTETFYYTKDCSDKNGDCKIGIAATDREKKSKEMAQLVQDYLVQELETTNRGIARKSLEVIRDTEIPAILVETGFLCNANDREKLTSSSIQQEAAVAIFRGISQFPAPL